MVVGSAQELFTVLLPTDEYDPLIHVDVTYSLPLGVAHEAIPVADPNVSKFPAIHKLVT